MDALEHIRTKKRMVGVITHVEDIKSRIPVKLLVEPAKMGEGGSKLRIEAEQEEKNINYEMRQQIWKETHLRNFSATNDIFAEHAWYFRNALVRANYTNLQKNIHETTEYLEVFLRNLLLNEKNELHNRSLHISGLWNEEKVDIERMFSEKTKDFSVKTMIHIHRLFKEYGYEEVFGRSTIMELLELKASGASKLISNLVQADIIQPVSGYGKGRYKFKKQ